MSNQSDELRIDVGEFINFYPQRTRDLMWFLGAGAAVGAGIPTASTLTWEFKRQLYCTAHRLPPNRIPNLNDIAFQTRMQSYFNASAGYPAAGDAEEYSFYFQRYLPDERDRRRFLEGRVTGVKPSYGYLCLAALLALAKVDLVWTTNFDELLERAALQNPITDRLPHGLKTAGIGRLEKADGLFSGDQWPLLVKLHGDFLHRRFKDLAVGAQSHDECFRRALTDQCALRGLAVVGYSGRDSAVVGAMREALGCEQPFPHGLFWFVRHGEVLSATVRDLLCAARQRGCQAGFIEVGGFDELMADLFLPYQDDLPAVRELVRAQRERRRPVMPIYTGRNWPVLRTNALEITKYPSSCTVFQADVQGAREVKELVAGNQKRVAAGRRKSGVIAFGTRADLLRVFGSHNPREFEPYPIESRRLLYQDSVEIGLFYDTLCEALSRQTGLRRSKNHKGRILYLPTVDALNPAERGAFKALNITPVRRPKPKGPLVHEAVCVSLEQCDKRLWLLLEPTLMITTDGTIPYAGSDRSEVGRDDLVRRYNRTANSLITLWLDFLKARCGSPLVLAFPETEEREAEFEIDTVTAFSRQSE